MELLTKVNQLKKQEIAKTVNARIKEFEEVGKEDKAIFSELCFCILTANSTAERCIKVQQEAGEQFHSLEENKLAEKLRKAGCRFHTKRAGYISEARQHKKELLNLVKKTQNKEISQETLRDWIAETIKGLGMKESSHFLRNIGFKNIAIIDFHIIDLLEKEKIIKKPKKLDKKTYLEIENTLKEITKKANLNLAELDLYLWYIETGRVLK